MANLFKLFFVQLIANGFAGWLARRQGRTTTQGANLPPPGPPPVVIDIVDGPSLPPPPVAPALTDEIEIL
jgi:hypothetical protein